MDILTAKKYMEIELECVKRNIAGCDRNCGQCDLAQNDTDIIKAYERVISYINSASQFYGG